MKYYKIVMRRAHVGRGYSAYITFYKQAKTLWDATQWARRQGGVKHSELPISADEIPYDEYKIGIATNAYVRAGAKL